MATGESHSVEEFSRLAFETVGLNYSDYIEISEDYKRPNEVNYLLGDASKAREKLNWETKVSFKELVEMMVTSDLEIAKKEKTLLDKNLISPTWEHPNKN